jgi:hypothetical protein
MQTLFDTLFYIFNVATAWQGLGTAELFVTVLVACGLLMIAISALLPKGKAEALEWWER